MGYIRAVVPLNDFRLFLDMESKANVIVDLSIKLHTMKYKELENESLFQSVKTDGDYVIWGGGCVKVTVKELMDIALYGGGA